MKKKRKANYLMGFHQVRKRFGQNFLHDEEVIQNFRYYFTEQTRAHLEIGPGLGALTKGSANSGAKLHCVELDTDLAESLKTEYAEYDKVKITQADALEFDLNSIARKTALRIVGNLPYNISTPLIFHLQ